MFHRTIFVFIALMVVFSVPTVFSEVETSKCPPAYSSNPESRLDLINTPAEDTMTCDVLRTSPNLLRIHLIGVGQEDCTLIECPNRQTRVANSAQLPSGAGQ